MRFLPLTLLFGAASLAAATGSLNTATDEDADRENTYFNQKKVPPMLALTPENYEKEIKASKWLLVKNFRYEIGTPYHGTLSRNTP
jgi:protein disulfide-isomerase